MRVCLYVFSGTGNTLKCAEAFKDAFVSRGANVLIHKITFDNGEVPDPKLFDYIGIGFPVHGFNAPQIMFDFVRALPDIDGKEYFFFRTSGEPLKWNDGASLFLEEALSGIGYRRAGEYGYVMPYNMIFRHDDGMASLMYKTMLARVPTAVDEILAGKPTAAARPRGGKTLSEILLIEHPAMNINGKMFKVNADKCVKCMQCVRNCPTKNIRYENGKFVFGYGCVMCARCSFNCPTDAFNIAMLNGWRVNGKYNFNAEPQRQQGKHAGYCKKAYDSYFGETDGCKNS